MTGICWDPAGQFAAFARPWLWMVHQQLLIATGAPVTDQGDNWDLLGSRWATDQGDDWDLARQSAVFARPC